ncbi:MAG: hypothetical protein K8T26_00845 [Lentisphaerae bacterium]|nr:hypothetical protein [Lentisphaerota bacterium]
MRATAASSLWMVRDRPVGGCRGASSPGDRASRWPATWGVRPGLAIALLLVAGRVQAVGESARTLDGGGGVSTGAVHATVSAFAQPAPVGVTASPHWVNRAGFLEMFVARPNQDADGDLRPDENDLDDDADGLADLEELEGHAFVPVTVTDPLRADSDADDMADGAEALAGTNPRDADSRLEILSVGNEMLAVTVTWASRAGYTYDVVSGTTLADLATNPVAVARVTAANGSGPWQATVSTGTVAVASSRPRAFYRVSLVGP